MLCSIVLIMEVLYLANKLNTLIIINGLQKGYKLWSKLKVCPKNFLKYMIDWEKQLTSLLSSTLANTRKD